MLKCYDIKIIKNDKDEIESFYCNICNYPLSTKDDFASNLKFFCCDECYMTFIESDIEAWKSGKRPKQKFLDSYIAKKKDIYKKREAVKNEFS